MNKQIVWTMTGILLSFAIAIGGWALTGMIIERKSETLLAAAGTVTNQPEETADVSPVSLDKEEKVRPRLSEQEMVYVLTNWDADGNEQAHEPMRTQLTMEEAIHAAKSGLRFFHERGYLSGETLEEMLETEKINAYLLKKHVSGQSSEFFDPIYSYWTVTLTSEWMAMTFTINAYTGQVWKINIEFYSTLASFEQAEAAYVLSTFAAYLGKEAGETISLSIGGNELRAYTGIADDVIRANIHIRANQSSRLKLFAIYEINMYLSAE